MTQSAPSQLQKSQAMRVRIHVDLFAYTLATLSFGWMMMNLLRGWHFGLAVQTAIILTLSLLWTLFGSLAMHAIKTHVLER